jgi:hypothetical protein
MSDILIPNNMDQVTPEWLTQIMALQPGSDKCRIIGRHVEDLNIEAGFISQLARITLEYEAKSDNLPDSLIVKLAPLDDTTRNISKSLGHFQREVAFYKYFAEDCPANPPKPFHADIDATADNFVVVIEDIGFHDPQKFFDGCTLAEAKLVLRALGGLHAKYWNERNLEGHDWVSRASQTVDPLIAMVPQAIPDFATNFGDYMPKSLRDGLDHAVSNFEHILNAGQHLPDQTLCHVDAHLGNIAFESGQARFFDWQAFMVHSGSYDVALFINANLREADRRANMPELLNTYHEALVDGGVLNYSRQDVEKYYHRQAAVLWVLIPLFAGAFITSDERGEIFAATWLPRIFSALVDSDAPKQLDIWLNESGA